MNTQSTTTTASVKLNSTFVLLANGAISINDVIAERAATRAAMIAREDAIARCRREWNETREQFFTALAY